MYYKTCMAFSQFSENDSVVLALSSETMFLEGLKPAITLLCILVLWCRFPCLDLDSVNYCGLVIFVLYHLSGSQDWYVLPED